MGSAQASPKLPSVRQAYFPFISRYPTPTSTPTATYTPTRTPTPTHTPTPTPFFVEQCDEPNNTFPEACGPLAPDRDYLGDFPSEADEWDVYYILLMRVGSVVVWLTDIPDGNDYNLYLYDNDINLRGYSGEVRSRDEHISVPQLPPGKYDLVVTREQGMSVTQSYRLRAWF